MYRKYFQKSKIFLYPLLNIERGVDFVPVETFLTWNKHYELKDKKFMCLYEQKKSKKWLDFEKNFLLSNPLFHDYMLLDKDVHLYIYDMKDYSSDYRKLADGKYSRFTTGTKDMIINFFGEKGKIAQYVEEYLYPDYYHKVYAEELNVEVEALEAVHELCDKPDLEKENLIYKKPSSKIVFKKKMLSLWSNSKYILT